MFFLLMSGSECFVVSAGNSRLVEVRCSHGGCYLFCLLDRSRWCYNAMID